MSSDERTVLTHGIFALPFAGALPDGAVAGAGYVAGIPRLGVPALTETDASLGVAWVGGVRGPEGATPLPATLALASTWSPALARRAGAAIGAEARAKGFNVLLAGGANLIREPRNGRAFEYFSEDPLLTGVLAGESIAGVQSNHIISTVKHFALNDQESARNFLDVRISDAAARESDLLAFQIAVERGQPGAVMCGYNMVNGASACASDWLLNRVLKKDWRYPGFVMSDWGAVGGMSFALRGLDQQSATQLDKQAYFNKPLNEAVRDNGAFRKRVEDMNRRILYAIYANGLDRHPVKPRRLDTTAGLAIAEQIEREGIVLLKNRGALPLAASAKRITVIGNYADTGVLSGGGSSQVQLDGGPVATIPLGGGSLLAPLWPTTFQRSVPLTEIRKRAATTTEVSFARSNYIAEAVKAAVGADVALVFAHGWRTEGQDVPDLSLPDGQDALIEAVARANPRTVVVLQTGGPVSMPWLDRVDAVVEAWYPGGRGAEAIASVLFGETNPSGRLPVTFPASIADLPRPLIDGIEYTAFTDKPPPLHPVRIDYDVEGSDVGYRWHFRERKKPLFPFGFGLSYTSFRGGKLETDGKTATFEIANTGRRSGADVGQLYLTSAAGRKLLRLVGFQRIELAPGQTGRIRIEIDQRLLARWNGSGWVIDAGTYNFAIGTDAQSLQQPVSTRLSANTWTDESKH